MTPKRIFPYSLIPLVPAALFICASARPLAPFQLTEEERANQATAVACMRIINTAEVTYSSMYNKGYSRNLAVLGPPEHGASATPAASGLIDDTLATGKKAGYVFTYKAGPPDKKGMIMSYTLMARPVKWHKGLQSYFSDESAVIRSTDQNRAPTAKDSPL